MLAWVHQAIAAEREFLEGLFGARAEEGGRMVGAVRAYGGTEEEDWMSELMDTAVGGLCTPLMVSEIESMNNLCNRIVDVLYRFEFNKPLGLKRVVSQHTRSQIYCSSTCSQCSGRWAKKLHCPRG